MTANLTKSIAESIEKLGYEIICLKEKTDAFEHLFGAITITIRPKKSFSKEKPSNKAAQKKDKHRTFLETFKEATQR